jgi:hypothetical protein
MVVPVRQPQGCSCRVYRDVFTARYRHTLSGFGLWVGEQLLSMSLKCCRKALLFKAEISLFRNVWLAANYSVLSARLVCCFLHFDKAYRQVYWFVIADGFYS